MTARGLLIANEVIEGTDWIRRDPSAFWQPGERGTRPRAKTITQIVGHWTAGEAGAKRFDDDGPFVVRGMKARRSRKTGELMRVGIHFVIGACAEDDLEATVWQTADPGRVAVSHVARGFVNARSIGVEVVSAGKPGELDTRERPRARVPLLGQTVEVLRFYPGQLRAWRRLAETLAALDGRGGIRIPRRVPEQLGSKRMTLPQLRRWQGALEHLHVGPSKVDAAGLLVGALLDAGWEAVRP